MQIIKTKKKKPAGVANISIFLILKLGGAGEPCDIIGIRLCVPPENNAGIWSCGATRGPLWHLQLHLTALQKKWPISIEVMTKSASDGRMRGDGKWEGVIGSSVKFVRTQSRRHKSIFYKTRRGINGPRRQHKCPPQHLHSHIWMVDNFGPGAVSVRVAAFVQAEN